jgi:hypothetical protein
VVGTFLSESFMFIRKIPPPFAKTITTITNGLFKYPTLEELLRSETDAREAHVYIHTGSLDLGWYSGRVRMLGGTGLALIIAAAVAIRLNYSWTVFWGFIISGLLAVVVALYRSRKYDTYVAASSAVLNRSGHLISPSSVRAEPEKPASG